MRSHRSGSCAVCLQSLEISRLHLLSLASFAPLPEIRFCILGVLSAQKDAAHRGVFRQFFAGQQMSYYGGPELLEALKALRLPTIGMGPTGDFWIDPIRSRESG
jgi:hypothetical protein